MKRLIWLMALLLTLGLVLTGCQTSPSQSGIGEDTLRIGMVFDSAGAENPFFVRAQQGLERAREQFGTVFKPKHPHLPEIESAFKWYSSSLRTDSTWDMCRQPLYQELPSPGVS